jgi:hypothetical protein
VLLQPCHELINSLRRIKGLDFNHLVSFLFDVEVNRRVAELAQLRDLVIDS